MHPIDQPTNQVGITAVTDRRLIIINPTPPRPAPIPQMLHTTPLLKIRLGGGGGGQGGEVLVVFKDAFVIIAQNELQVSLRVRICFWRGRGVGGLGTEKTEGLFGCGWVLGDNGIGITILIGSLVCVTESHFSCTPYDNTNIHIDI